MRKWEIFPKHSLSTVFRNCFPILFLNSQRFLHHFSDFLWFLDNTFWITWFLLKIRISEISPKLLFFKLFRNISKDFLSFFDFLKIFVSSDLLNSKKIWVIQGKWDFFLNFPNVKFLRISQNCRVLSSAGFQ